MKFNPASSFTVATANSRILEALEQPVPMRFPQETSLEGVLNYIKAVTRGPGPGPPIPIYVDSVALSQGETWMPSTVSIDLEGAPLKTTLRLALGQLGLEYRVREGVLWITSQAPPGWDSLVYQDPFVTIAQCLLAMLAAVLGGVAAPLMSRVTSDS